MNPDDIRLMLDTDPFALAAKYLFIAGAFGLYALCVTRQKMNYVDAAKAIVGLKSVQNRDWIFTLVHIGTIVGVLVLMTIAMQRNLGGGAA